MIMNEITPSTRLIDATFGQFEEWLRNTMTKIEDEKKPAAAPKLPEKRVVYGLKGISDLFQCSRTTANRIKQSGVIDDAIVQFGRQIIVDADMALKLFKNGKDNK